MGCSGGVATVTASWSSSGAAGGVAGAGSSCIGLAEELDASPCHGGSGVVLTDNIDATLDEGFDPK